MHVSAYILFKRNFYFQAWICKEKIVVIACIIAKDDPGDTKEKTLSVSGRNTGRNIENFIKFVISLKNWVKGRRFFEISWRLTKEAAGRRRHDSRKPDWPYTTFSESCASVPPRISHTNLERCVTWIFNLLYILKYKAYYYILIKSPFTVTFFLNIFIDTRYRNRIYV